MENPFKFGTLVDTPYFADRIEEQAYISQYVNSPNHLVLISPRRFGKSSLVKRAISQTGRPCISINMQQITRVEDLTSMLLKGVFRIYKWEKMKYLITHFRVVPTVTTSPFNDEMEFSFNMAVNSSNVILEDTFSLLEKVSDPKNRIIVVFDEFQEIIELEKGIDKRLRAIMQEQKNINYIFLGSQESMMTDIFEKVKSPFFHFGTLMHLNKIPHDDFLDFITQRLSIFPLKDSKEIATEILNFTKCHPYYTQQLAFMVWELLYIDKLDVDVVKEAISKIVLAHDLDFERFWISLNKTDRRILQKISSRSQDLYSDRTVPTSTTFSSLKRLMTKGYIIRTETYELEDPFFEEWIIKNVPLVS
jgi:AAA+ ATPase superfamily predicted ATPase